MAKGDEYEPRTSGGCGVIGVSEHGLTVLYSFFLSSSTVFLDFTV